MIYGVKRGLHGGILIGLEHRKNNLRTMTTNLLTSPPPAIKDSKVFLKAFLSHKWSILSCLRPSPVTVLYLFTPTYIPLCEGVI